MIALNKKNNFIKILLLIVFFLSGCSWKKAQDIENPLIDFEGKEVLNKEIGVIVNITCEIDDDCKIVKSPHPCLDITSINKSNSAKEWDNFYRKELRLKKDIHYSCPAMDYNSKNSKAFCNNGICDVTKANINE